MDRSYTHFLAVASNRRGFLFTGATVAGPRLARSKGNDCVIAAVVVKKRRESPTARFCNKWAMGDLEGISHLRTGVRKESSLANESYSKHRKSCSSA